MLRLDRKEITCILTCVGDSFHRILLRDKEKTMLGRAKTIDPNDEDIPEVQFAAVVSVARRRLYVTLIDGEGYINGDAMENNVHYTLEEGDTLGFSEEDIHQYQLTFMLPGIDWPAPLDGWA